MGPVAPQVVDAFGLVIQCRELGGNHPLLPMTVHTLRQAISPGKPIYPACMQFPTEDYKKVRPQTFLLNTILIDLLSCVLGSIIMCMLCSVIYSLALSLCSESKS